MGEAKRKKLAALTETMKNIQQDGQGVFVFDLYPSSYIPKIMTGAFMGDKKAVELLQPVMSMVKAICNSPKGSGPLCLTCNVEFTKHTIPPAGFIILGGYNSKGPDRVLNMLCDDCFAHPDVENRVFEKIRDNMIPDARKIQISNIEGCA